MKQELQKLIGLALRKLAEQGGLPIDAQPAIEIQRTRDMAHGDFASNIALVLAKPARRKPRDLAEAIAAEIPISGIIAKVEIAGPGFINFFLSDKAFQQVIAQILEAGNAYGRSDLGAGRRIQIEFVSANPNGPLHIGHGRGAAYGAVLACLLEEVGYKVHREYYVNDAGRQMDILTVSVWLRYLEFLGETVVFPDKGYRGDYVREIAAQVAAEMGRALHIDWPQFASGLPQDAGSVADPEKTADVQADNYVARAKSCLGEDNYRRVFELGLHAMLNIIREDLAAFGVSYDRWFSERSLITDGAVERALGRLRAAGQIYEQDGAQWFRATAFGDEKDRVVVRENGVKTYFANDIAYHLTKFERGFDFAINVWGADHHGYIPRVKAALTAMGEDPAHLEVLLVQFATLYRGGERAQMSTRSGEFVTLRELCEEVGRDAARFFYVMRRCDQHLDFDLDLAKSRSADNPVYYIQYAHARICSVFKQLQDKNLSWDQAQGATHAGLLNESHEQELLRRLSAYPEAVELAARQREPHQIAQYLRDLANELHVYYNAHRFLVDDAHLRDARLNLIAASRQVLVNGLGLLGVSAPSTM